MRLNGSTSGYTEIDAPAVAGSNTLVLPTGNGSSGQVLSTNGSGALSWASQRILQVVQATYSTQATSASTSFSSTGLTASITPQFSSSKIFVLINVVAYANASNRGIRFQITRGSTDIYNAPTYSLYCGSTNIAATQSLSYLDSPSTTSSTSYTLNFATPEAATVTVQYQSAPSTIILMEVAA